MADKRIMKIDIEIAADGGINMKMFESTSYFPYMFQLEKLGTIGQKVTFADVSRLFKEGKPAFDRFFKTYQHLVAHPEDAPKWALEEHKDVDAMQYVLAKNVLKEED
jgi:hypothetical protein